MATTVLFQLGTTEWENIGPTINPDYSFFLRPEWLYPVVLISMSAFIGLTTLHLTRRVGSATLVFVLTLLLRLALLRLFNASESANMTYKANILTLAPLVGLDLWYAYRLRTGHIEAPNTAFGGSLILALTTFVITLPLISRILYYPRLFPTVIVGVIVFGLLMAIAAGWAGSHLGAWLRVLGCSTAEEPSSAALETQQILWLGAGALLAAVAFLAIFVSTATPPVL